MKRDSTYTKEQLKNLNDDELLSLLKKSWGVRENEPIQVIGELSLVSSTSEFFILKNVLLLNGLVIEYPLINLSNNISDNGIFVALKSKTKLDKYVDKYQVLIMTCNLVLSPKSERIKHGNLFELNVLTSSIKLVAKRSYKSDSSEVYKKRFTNESILEYIEKTNIEDAVKKIEQLNQSENRKKDTLKKLEEKRELITRNILEQENNMQDLNIKFSKLENKIKREKETMAIKLERLRTFIKGKADTLLNLEFIDQEEYNNLLMLNQDIKVNEKVIDFENDLQSDKQKAISHIQAYLFEQDIVYPRYILEDFLALIQTNDLIILAGESGSGKTNLIKSFAQAIGGKSFIIPVKPNWTSSEDLLGYYNPLEKKYLTTPFLEALLEAKYNPDIPYFICLDEMNLARVEYYFADFLSLLEERKEEVNIELYSEDESSHILSEFNMVLSLIESTKKKFSKNDIEDYIGILEDTEINQELKRVFGFSDKDSLIKYHSDLKRMLSGVLGTPASIDFPNNVRIIGAINIDETTHYLSPKILDRAHIMKFDSPLLQDWEKIEKEVKKEDIKNKELKIKFKIEDLGSREEYPKFDRNDHFCKIITNMTKEYFSPLGIEVGLRTIRQGLNYKKIFIDQGSNEELVINNFIIHKILPKLTFDGAKKIKEKSKLDLLEELKLDLQELINQDITKMQGIDAVEELEKIIEISNSNSGIVNYWA